MLVSYLLITIAYFFTLTKATCALAKRQDETSSGGVGKHKRGGCRRASDVSSFHSCSKQRPPTGALFVCLLWLQLSRSTDMRGFPSHLHHKSRRQDAISLSSQTERDSSLLAVCGLMAISIFDFWVSISHFPILSCISFQSKINLS
jgi:hypothetical protein